ncbi:MAG: hypothetical protein Q4P28_04420 [Tissierellia bacterium]|nr:hypothetical protein [Tissierellia bacterium]
MNQEKVSFRKVISYSGAFIALLIGSGFATGQEVMQYFASFGLKGIFGTITALILLSYVGMSFITTGYRERFEKGNDIYYYICGNKVGAFYDYFSIFFIFLSVTVMISGAGATGSQHYNWPNFAGGLLMGICAILTVILGLNRIVDVIGNIGPVIVIISIVVAVITLFKFGDQLSAGSIEVQEIVARGEIKQASTNWFLAAGSYVGFCMLWLAAFLAQVGKSANSNKEAKLGGFGGALGFSVAVLLLALALISQITELQGSQIPSLILAGEISPLLANIFSVIIFLGIYTTSVPLLWTVVSRFSEEGTSKFRLLTVVVGAVAVIIGLNIQFDTLVNIVYVLNGYLGMILLLFMIYRSITEKRL